MSKTAVGHPSRIDQFFSGPGARGDQWLSLVELAEAWSSGSGTRTEFDAALAQMTPTEEFHAYPGVQLLTALRDHAAEDDARATASLARRIARAILTRSFRLNLGEWEADDEGDRVTADVLPPALGRADAHRPYFEVLIVTGAPATRWPALCAEWRRLRRPLDAFIYEPVFVGSFEDAFCATVLNSDVAAVVIHEGFTFRSRHDVPILRTLTETMDQHESGNESALSLARVLKRVRPELDLYLVANGRVEDIAGDPKANAVRRIFYAVEELLELHLAILEGVQDRYDTPFFNNLKKYAQRPIGTFHALPIARGKSIFKSDWIRDMGEFYGPTLFLAESSATTGGLDSLLEPTGNIKKAQDMAARAFGADHVFFVTNGTSTSNKMAVQALLAPGDIAIVDRNCHKSHHYGMVLAGAQPLYVEAFPMTEYSMYGAVPLRTIKQALLNLKADGRLDRAKMVDLTNCTFDGHIYNTRRVMEECLAIKPDLIFLWDEAWFGFGRFSPFLRPRTAMGAANDIEAWLHDPKSIAEYEKQKAELGADPPDDVLLNTRLIPDPRKVKLRVYQTNSTHKSMSALRQGSMLLVKDVEFHSVEAQFHEAVFTHASTSPTSNPLRAARRAPTDGIGGIRAGPQRNRSRPGNSKGGWCAPFDLQVFPHPWRRQDGAGAIPQERVYRLPVSQIQLGRGVAQHQGRRVLPRSHAHDACLRHGRLRRYAIQRDSGGPLQHPAQQDVAQLRPVAVQHQQYAERRCAFDPGAGGDQHRDRPAFDPGRSPCAAGLRCAREEFDDGRAGLAELFAFPRCVPERCG